MSEKTQVDAPKGFKVTREVVPEYGTIRYRFAVDMYFDLNIPAEADADNDYREATLGYGLRQVAEIVSKRCAKVLA